ncbi:tRNA 2-selenouridine(34) synthase MnmH [Aliiroseovarius sp. PTFE2010]|uniref:tRNA 2-selenouridine(34) synthase MnmH n=1 Tax=Aliiroseovarius sp. PTFE2010 TaxID=3417190 RepID=UPI003CF44861
MAQVFDTLEQVYGHGFDTVIDVRSPAEYAHDHIPGAISLPVLSNEQRAHVGTIYKQVSPFDARKIGAALVARNAAAHISGPLADKPGGWRPLIYCWRGGQRSNSFASILQQIGWRADVLDGGYQTYRRLVVAAMHDTALPHRLVLLDGNTGTAKTALLQRVAAHGGQVVDLEALAGHRGSLFGRRAGGQPSQKAFEGRLAAAFGALDPARAVLVEGESSRIGALTIPPSVWKAMCAADRTEVSAPLAARARYLVRVYDDIRRDADGLTDTLASMVPLVGRAQVDSWLAMAASGEYEALAAALMTAHYDPRYAKSRARYGARITRTLHLEDLDPDTLERAARDLAQPFTA